MGSLHMDVTRLLVVETRLVTHHLGRVLSLRQILLDQVVISLTLVNYLYCWHVVMLLVACDWRLVQVLDLGRRLLRLGRCWG